MKIVKIIFYVFASIFGVYTILCLMGPKNFNVTKSLKMHASPASVFEEISDFSHWASWSPWVKRDPNMKSTINGEAGKIGHSQSWESENVGSGTQTIVEIKDRQSLKTELVFTDWDGKSYAEFILKPMGDSTEVSWTLQGDDLPFMARGFIFLMGGAKMIEKDYTEGLAGLKKVTEAKPTAPAISYEVTEINETIYVGKRMKLKAAEIDSSLFGKTYAELMMAIGGPQKIAGMPFSIGHFYDEKTGDMDLEIALPVAAEMKVPAGLNCGKIAAGKCAKYIFKGPYEGTAAAWSPFMSELTKKHKPRFAGYEVYANDPGVVKNPADFITWLMVPIE